MTTETSTTEQAPVPGRWPSLRNLVELFALCGLAIAQPLLDIFGRSSDQFIFRNAGPADIWVFALVVTFGPPLALWAVESLVGLVLPRARAPLHLALLAALGWAFTVQAARGALGGLALMALAAAAGVAVAWLRHRYAAMRLWLSFAAVAPLVFMAQFVFGSGSSRLVFAEDPRAARAGIDNPAPVVMVVLDELPLQAVMTSEGTLDAELVPNLAELAGGATWYRNATAVSSSTWHAVPSLVTGRYPDSAAAPVAADHPESLFTLLGGAYDMNVTESVTRLCPASVCEPRPTDRVQRGELLGDALGVMATRLSWSGDPGDPVAGLVEDPGPAEAQPDPGGGDGDAFADFELDQPERFRALLDGAGTGPTLDYLHLLLPHVPYRYVPSGVRYPGPNPDIGRVEDDWTDQAWPPALGRQRLQLQMGYVDVLVGELVDSLRDRGRYDESMIVLTSDHGIAFRPGGPIRGIEGQSLGDDDLAALAWVPLVVKYPGQAAGEVSDANVETIDLLPTIAEVLGVDLPWAVDGRSLLGPERSGEPKRFHPSDVNAFGVEALDPLELDGPALWPRIVAGGTDRVLPQVGSPQRYWQAGPSPELVGRPVAGLGPGASPVAGVSFDGAGPGAGATAAVERGPDPATAPALVQATLPEGEPGGEFAVVVNGEVAATAPSHEQDGATRVAVMVDPARLRPGSNELALLRLR